MTVILAFMAIAIACSLFVAHIASQVAARLLAERRDPETRDRVARDLRYRKIL
jgi:hypothetical protein